MNYEKIKDIFIYNESFFKKNMKSVRFINFNLFKVF